MIKGHKYTITSLQELEQFAAQEFLPFLLPQDDGAIIVGLEGDLGSGKTAFVKIIAKLLGISDQVVSPTFIIAKFYPIPKATNPEVMFESPKDERVHPHFHELVHIDAYRMEKPEEAGVLRLPELSNDQTKLIFIEWPELLGDQLPKGNIMLHFDFIDENTRSITQIN